MTLQPIEQSMLNSIEAAFRGCRMDPGEQARLCTDMILESSGFAIPLEVRAKMEDILFHGITPEHIVKALAEMRKTNPA